MTIAALLHPEVSAALVLPFRKISPDIRTISDLEHTSEPLSAALILSGDADGDYAGQTPVEIGLIRRGCE
jgi:hypothetical protein